MENVVVTAFAADDLDLSDVEFSNQEEEEEEEVKTTKEGGGGGGGGKTKTSEKKKKKKERIEATIESLLFHRPGTRKKKKKKKTASKKDVALLGGRPENYGVDALPWVEKYRPKSLDDVSSHHAIITSIRGMIETQCIPHMLFYGPPGTGKTSTILACANEMYGEQFSTMVLEINASDDNSINVVRDQVKVFAGTRQLFNKGVKLIILDEAEEMSSEAQAALKRVIEEYSETTRFCFICNFIDKIIPAIQSRCTRFRFPPLPEEHILEKMTEVIAAEGLVVDAGGQAAILKMGRGDMRRVLNTMQSCKLAQSDVTEDVVYNVTGYPSPKDMGVIVDALCTQGMKAAHDTIATLLHAKGLSLTDVVTELGEASSKPDFVLYSQDKAKAVPVMCCVLKRLADIECALIEAASDQVQLSGVVAVFSLARHMQEG